MSKKSGRTIIRPLSADIGVERMTEVHHIACRRTAWVLDKPPCLNWSIRNALVQAYTQGICDTSETIEAVAGHDDLIEQLKESKPCESKNQVSKISRLSRP